MNASQTMRAMLANAGIFLDAAPASPTATSSPTTCEAPVDRALVHEILVERGAPERDLGWLVASCPSVEHAIEFEPTPWMLRDTNNPDKRAAERRPGRTIVKHCDDFIDDESAPAPLRAFLDRARQPAHGHLSSEPFPRLFADHDGQRVRVVMASRLGDVGITSDLAADHGYSKRVAVEELSNFGDAP